jgi:hypothetical protein
MSSIFYNDSNSRTPDYHKTFLSQIKAKMTSFVNQLNFADAYEFFVNDDGLLKKGFSGSFLEKIDGVIKQYGEMEKTYLQVSKEEKLLPEVVKHEVSLMAHQRYMNNIMLKDLKQEVFIKHLQAKKLKLDNIAHSHKISQQIKLINSIFDKRPDLVHLIVILSDYLGVNRKENLTDNPAYVHFKEIIKNKLLEEAKKSEIENEMLKLDRDEKFENLQVKKMENNNSKKILGRMFDEND